MNYLFGIDIGGTTVKIGLVSWEGKILKKFEIPTDKSDGGAKVLPDIRDALYQFMKAEKIVKEEVVGIGFGIPGPVRDNVVFNCVNLGWKVKNVKKEFVALLDWEPNIVCGNDANVAALGEMWVGSQKKYHDLVMFTLGTGVGSSIIINNVAVDGAHGTGGELGHMRLDNKYNFPCNCGLTGCFETVASATGVVRVAKAHLGSMPSLLDAIEVDKLTCKDVFDAAKNGDALALAIVDEVGRYIAHASSIAAAAVDPEVFIIGGGVSKAGQILIDAIEKYYKDFAFHMVKTTPFILASLGNDGGMLGAALLSKKQ